MLTINYNATDLSLKLEEFAAPTQAITLLSTEFIYVGYYKPITNLYFEFTSTVTSLSTLSVEYETASGFVNVDNLVDRTNGLGESGKVSWEIETDNQVSSLLFGKTLYWYKFSVDVATVARAFVGINVLFSNDKDLIEEYPGIMSNLPTGNVSFVNFNASARKDIVQALRKKYNADAKLLTQFDLLNNEEVKQASKYLALSKIFDWLSDAPDDNWSVKSSFYYNKHSDYLNNITLTIDSNDNGKTETSEQNTIQFVRVVRV